MLRCVTYNCNSIRNNSEIVKHLLSSSDIVFLQEIMLNKSDLPLLNDFHKEFMHIADVKDRESEGISEGRPSKGVAIFWKKHLSSLITPVMINDYMIGIILKSGDSKILLLNAYMPCDKQTVDSLDAYRNAIAIMESVVKEHNINNVVIAGDFNADPNKGRFWSELSSFRRSFSMSHMNSTLPNNCFTYLCPAKNTTSWLDHIFCTKSVSKYVTNAHVDYSMAIFDHFPLVFNLALPVERQFVISNDNFKESFVDWNKIRELERKNIREKIEEIIVRKGIMHNEVFACTDVNCINCNHIETIVNLFCELKNIYTLSTEEYRFNKSKTFKIIPGWNDEVKDIHAVARQKFLIWRDNGRPLTGPLLEDMKSARSLFRQALRNCKDNESYYRNKRMVDNLKGKRYKEFWKEVENVRSHNKLCPQKIDDFSDSKEICELFSNKYRRILANQQCRSTPKFKRLNISNKDKVKILMRFSIYDIKRAINSLNAGIGFDGIHSNHLKVSPDICNEFISMLFSSFVIHSYIPIDMLRGVITPIVKDSFGDLSSSENYRPVMSSSVLLKLLEYCILDKINPLVTLDDRQHGFRTGHSTASACLLLKETIMHYKKGNSDVYACFVDISKAFDSVNHDILMQKLIEYGIPFSYINVIHFMYSNQIVNVKFGSCVSSEWEVKNGVRQGGVLSSLFFSIYIDILLRNISELDLGCRLGILRSNIIAYADDLVLLSPSAKGLQELIDKAYSEALDIDLKFNYVKTKCMVFRSGGGMEDDGSIQNFKINENNVEFVNSVRYLGYIISKDFKCNEDITRARNKFYAQFNMLLRKFHFSDTDVKIFLFRQFCMQVYGCELWFSGHYSTTLFKGFGVGYHKAIKKVLNLSYHESNHYACQEAQVFTFKHFMNKSKIIAALRMFTNPCSFILKILDFFIVSSVFLKDVYNILRDVYNVDSLMFNDKQALISRIGFVQNHEAQMREPLYINVNS